MGRMTPVGQEEESVKMLHISLVHGPSPQPSSFIVTDAAAATPARTARFIAGNKDESNPFASDEDLGDNEIAIDDK